MRVANVLHDDRWAGPHRRVLEVGRELLNRGIETVVMVPEGNGSAFGRLQEMGLPCRKVRIQRIPRPGDLLAVIRWLLALPRDVLTFRRAFLEERIDLVHVNSSFFIPPALAARSVQLPLLWHLNETLVPPRIARILGFFVQRVSTVSAVAANAVAAHYGLEEGRFVTLYAPVDPTRFPSNAERVERELSERSGSFRIGLIANWNPLKGHIIFLRSLALLVRRGWDVRGVLLGAKFSNHTSYTKQVEKAIEDLSLANRVDDLGFKEDIVPSLMDLDVLALASFSEACPIVVLEGMAAGVPVVATDVGGVRELLTPKPSHPAGLVVQPNNPVDLAEGIESLLSDSRIRKTFGENGKDLVRDRFSLGKSTEGHRRAYEEALSIFSNSK